VQVDNLNSCAESAYGVCNECLKLEYHRHLSTFAFTFNLRRYILEDEEDEEVAGEAAAASAADPARVPLVLRGLTKVYAGKPTPALDGVSLAATVGLARCCSARYSMPFKSRKRAFKIC